MTTEERLLYSTSTLMGVAQSLYKPGSFFGKTIFTEKFQSHGEFINLDDIEDSEDLAGFVGSPDSEATLVENQAFKTRIFRPTTIKEKKQVTAHRAMRRMAGEVGLTTQGATPPLNLMQRATQLLGKELKSLVHRVERTEEKMMSDMLNTGSFNVVGKDVNETIDLQMPASHKITLTGDDLFSSSNSDIIAQISEWQTMISDDGGLGPANVAVIGSQVWYAILNHPQFKGVNSAFNALRVDIGGLKPIPMPEQKASHLGLFNFNGMLLDIYTYYGTYKDPITRLQTPFMPKDKIFIMNTLGRPIMAHGAIVDFGAEDPASVNEFRPYVTEQQAIPMPRFLDSWVTRDPKARVVMLQSHPLALLAKPKCFASIKAV